jgi:hypothetical protein
VLAVQTKQTIEIVLMCEGMLKFGYLFSNQQLKSVAIFKKNV